MQTWGPEAFARRTRTKIHNFGAPLPPWEDKTARPTPAAKGIPKSINIILLGPTGTRKQRGRNETKPVIIGYMLAQPQKALDRRSLIISTFLGLSFFFLFFFAIIFFHFFIFFSCCHHNNNVIFYFIVAQAQRVLTHFFCRINFSTISASACPTSFFC